MKSIKERFEILKALHVPGQDTSIDEWVRLCEIAIQNKPYDPITEQLIESTISSIVQVRDRAEIAEQVELMDAETRAIYEEIRAMSPDNLRRLADHSPQFRQAISALLWHTDEIERLSEEAKRLRKHLLGLET